MLTIRRWFPYCLFAAVAILHFFNLYRFAVDVPHYDEWDYVRGIDGVLRLGDWGWFFRRENEHLITLTKFQLFLAYFANGWNTRIVQLFNFPLFLLVPILCGVSLRRAGLNFGTAAIFFFTFTLAPTAWENHSMSSQSCLHFVFLLLGASAWLLMVHGDRWSAVAGSVVTSLLAALSFANGVTGALAICLVYVLKRGLRAQSMVALALHLAIFPLFQFLSGGVGSAGLGARVFTTAFWRYLSGLFVFGYGVESGAGIWQYTYWLGPPLFALLVYPLWKRRRSFETKHWLALAYVAAILAGLALISLGRCQMPEGVNGSRYFEFAMLLPALTAILWCDRLADEPRALARFQWAFGVFLFFTFLNNWTFLPYRRVQETRLGVLECIHRIRTGQNAEGRCERASSAKLGPSLEAADRLRLSFTRPRP